MTLEPADGGTQVTIAQRQKLRGYSRTGGFMLRRATRSKLEEALEGLERVCASRPQERPLSTALEDDRAR